MDISGIHTLPDDIIREIHEWIPYHVRATLCSTNYEKYRDSIQTRVRSNSKTYRRFIRSLIRQDNATLFKEYLDLDGVRWSRIPRWYQDGRHTSYLHFLRYVAHTFESGRCLYTINQFMEQHNIYIV